MKILFSFSTFNWSVPFLSYLLMVILLLGTVVLYIVPIRYLLLAWGVNKFTKRIRKPNAIPNNELLDFLSRVPSDPEVVRQFVIVSSPEIFEQGFRIFRTMSYARRFSENAAKLLFSYRISIFTSFVSEIFTQSLIFPYFPNSACVNSVFSFRKRDGH